LTETFSLLEKESGSIASSLRRQTPDFQSAVQAQYNEVFKLTEEMPETTRIS
jgi:hypothetical protein